MKNSEQTEAEGDGRPLPRTPWLREASGACGDLGTLLPYVLGALTIAGLAPAGVLLGFAAFLIASGLIFAVPIAVQPMKAVGAVMLSSGLGPGEIAAAGIVIGAVFLVLGITGAISRLARLVPQSVTAGLQLGLGLSMGWLGFTLMGEMPWLGAVTLAATLALMCVPRFPAALAALLIAVGLAHLSGAGESLPALAAGLQLPDLVMPTWDDVLRATELAVVPQLALTLTNAVIVTAALAHDLLPDRARRATVRNLALSTGLANLLLAPFGAMPMCHGAGGLQAQVRFGARSGMAPIMLGAVLLVTGLVFAPSAAALLAVIPIAAVGALLVIAGADLAVSKRLFDARPSCWPVIALTAGAVVLADPAVGLIAGWLVELVQRPLRLLLRKHSGQRPR